MAMNRTAGGPLDRKRPLRRHTPGTDPLLNGLRTDGQAARKLRLAADQIDRLFDTGFIHNAMLQATPVTVKRRLRANYKQILYAQHMDIGREIERALEAKGWNQSDLARKLGISAQAVQEWVAGDSRPAQKRWRQLADLLDIPFAYFAGEMPPRYIPELSPAALRMAKRFVGLPPELQDCLDKCITLMSEYAARKHVN